MDIPAFKNPSYLKKFMCVWGGGRYVFCLYNEKVYLL